jgi:hypothetical protein
MPGSLVRVAGIYLRRIALNVLNRETNYKRCLKQKSKPTAMDDNYIIQVLYCG